MTATMYTLSKTLSPAVVTLFVLLGISIVSAELKCNGGRYRVDCGEVGTTEEECMGKGCCWDEVDDDRPYCFYKNAGYKFCVPAAERSDCGYDTITIDECYARGCCWHPKDGEPYCFYRNSNAFPPHCPYDNRHGCGAGDVKQTECESQGCCWSPLEEGSAEPWCFSKFPPAAANKIF